MAIMENNTFCYTPFFSIIDGITDNAQSTFASFINKK